MRRLLLICCFFYGITAFAQQYNNEWIDYNKTYYKFKVGVTGLYRISQSALVAANLGNADVAQFQLWRNGQEVPIYTSNASGVLAVGGYVEFWGEANEGKADQPLYRNANDQINNSKSLFTDTAAYFLTINPAGANKRLTTTANSIPTGVMPESYFIYTSSTYFNESIHLGPYVGSVSEAAISASYEGGEGWTSNEISENQTRTFTQTGLYPYLGSGAPSLQVNMNVVGNSSNNRTVKLQLNGTDIFSTTLNSFEYKKLSATSPVTTLTGNTENFSAANIASVANNRIKVAFVELTYPRVFNFGGSSNFKFKMPASATGKYLEISGFTFSGTPVLYDLTNGRRYEADVSNPSLVKIYVQPSSVATDLVLVNEAGANIKMVAALETRNFVNYTTSNNQGDYLIITHSTILKATDGSNPVEDYRVYRSSVAGGGYNAKVYMIDQLTDQFAFGIKNSPLSVRNLIRYARNKFAVVPESVFLIGKGVKYISARMNESLPATEKLNLIPTFGEPASDVLLAAEGSSSIPLTPIGRVSVINGDELVIYLQKVKQYEQQLTPVSGVDASAWKKNVIHMVGASDQGLIDLLYGYLNRDKAIIEDTLYGAKVNDFVNSAMPGEAQNASDRLKDRINNGANLLTYFGHSTASTLLFNLENPENYSNAGKYPIFHMMGCSVGDIFILDQNRLNSLTTISEKYLLAKERGSIGMMAGTSLGYVSPLQQYNYQLYNLLSHDKYGSNLGDLKQAAIVKTFAASGGEGDMYIRAQCEEFTLNGDPAIKLYQANLPDYAIEDAMVSLDPAIVSAADANFSLKVKIANLGKAVSRNVIVELKRTFPDLSTKIIRTDTIKGIRYLDSLTYKMDINPFVDKGANKFTITIDPANTITELFKSNNSIVKDVYIYEDNIKPIYPYDYAIVNRQNIVLTASTGDPFAVQKSYVMEMDTTKLFNSSAKISQTKISAGGIVEFSSSVSFKDSTVYYWRVATASDNPTWNNASFTYIPGNNTKGFSQSHYYQLNGAADNGIFIDKNRLFQYDTLRGEIVITNGMYSSSGIIGSRDAGLFIGGIFVQGGYSGPQSFNTNANSLRFYLINNKTLQPEQNITIGTTGRYGSYMPLEWGSGYTIPGFFQFDISTTAARKTVMNFLDSIPSGYYVALTSNQWSPGVLPSVWKGDTTQLGKNVSLYHKLKTLGLSDLDAVQSEVPYIFLYQKGNPVPLAQMVGNAITDKLKLVKDIFVNDTKGAYISPIFTKSAAWDKLVWDGYSLENPTTDSVTFSVIGVDKNGTESVLRSNISISQKTVDLSSISAQTYPGLRIKMQSSDGVNRSPYQLKYWRIYGTPVPEGAIAPNLFSSLKDTVETGQPYNVGIAFKNVSDQPFDSLSIKLTIRDKNNVEKSILTPKVKPLISGDTVKVNLPIDTRSLTGTNLAYVEFNPETNHQPEQYQFNNFISKNFYVSGDSLNPYMDVTFDGVRILNRDIVSSKPDILIKLTDDAKYLLLNSTDLVKVQLRYPDGIVRNYQFNNDTLVFTPPGSANNNANTATINFKPRLLQDGDYELIVSGKDQSGNKTGNIDYRVAFQVINKPMISNLLNYPNPFTSSTAFVFTLTGSEVPQNIRIQILTITGKIVREITKAELGPLQIGRNITEFKWDGTDQYGQKLGNGVYLYRVLTNQNGKALDKYTPSGDNTDKYFNKGYGKMVLIR